MTQISLQQTLIAARQSFRSHGLGQKRTCQRVKRASRAACNYFDHVRLGHANAGSVVGARRADFKNPLSPMFKHIPQQPYRTNSPFAVSIERSTNLEPLRLPGP